MSGMTKSRRGRQALTSGRIRKGAGPAALALLVASLVILFPVPAEAEDWEWWTWSDTDLIREDDFRLHLYLDQRLAEERGSYVQIVSPRAKWRLHPHFDLGLGASVLSIEKGDTGSYYAQARPELELNPFFSLGDEWKLHFRNRVESRWNEFAGDPLIRTRHRVKLTWTGLDLGPLSGFYMNNEWFIDWESGRWSEDRLIPAAFTFDLGDSGAHLDLFYMLRFADRGSGWERDHVFGTFLRWSL